MTIPSPCATLPDEIAAMNALRALLAQEQACLAGGDIDGCAALLTDKAALLAALGDRASERHRVLAEAGFPASEQGMQRWLTHAPELANDEWKSLIEFTRDAHELNRINGVLLAGLSARNRQALAALGSGSDGTGLYGPAGQTDHSPHRAARAAG